MENMQLESLQEQLEENKEEDSRSVSLNDIRINKSSFNDYLGNQ